MFVVNTDLLRAVSAFDASGRPRPGQRGTSRPTRTPRRHARASLIFFVFLAWCRLRALHLSESGS